MNRNARQFRFEDDGIVPNNPGLPTLLVPGAIAPNEQEIETLYRRNSWTGIWVWTVFDYHHFHPFAHEVLVCLRGQATLQLGGASGEFVEFAPGDLCVLPAGVGHCRMRATSDFVVMGAYPANAPNGEIIRATPKSHSRHKAHIAHVPLPDACPVFGHEGPLVDAWKLAS